MVAGWVDGWMGGQVVGVWLGGCGCVVGGWLSVGNPSGESALCAGGGGGATKERDWECVV
jgi:hypothetical protein